MSCLFSSHPVDDDHDAENSSSAEESSAVSDDDAPKKEDNLLRVAVGSVNPSKVRAVSQALHQLAAQKKNTIIDLQSFNVASNVDDQPFGDADTMEGAKNRAKAAYRAYRDSNNGVKPHLAIAMEGGLEWIAVHRTGDASATSNNNNNHTKNQQDDSPEKDDTGHCAQSNLNHTSQGDNDSPQNALFCMAWIAVYGKRNGTVLEMLCSDSVAHYTGDRAPVFGLSRTASFALPPEITKLVITQQMELGDADNHVFQRSHDESKRGQGTVGILTDGLIDRPSYYEHAILLALTMWIRPDVYPTGFR